MTGKGGFGNDIKTIFLPCQSCPCDWDETYTAFHKLKFKSMSQLLLPLEKKKKQKTSTILCKQVMNYNFGFSCNLMDPLLFHAHFTFDFLSLSTGLYDS